MFHCFPFQLIINVSNKKTTGYLEALKRNKKFTAYSKTKVWEIFTCGLFMFLINHTFYNTRKSSFATIFEGHTEVVDIGIIHWLIYWFYEFFFQIMEGTQTNYLWLIKYISFEPDIKLSVDLNVTFHLIYFNDNLFVCYLTNKYCTHIFRISCHLNKSFCTNVGYCIQVGLSVPIPLSL